MTSFAMRPLTTEEVELVSGGYLPSAQPFLPKFPQPNSPPPFPQSPEPVIPPDLLDLA